MNQQKHGTNQNKNNMMNRTNRIEIIVIKVEDNNSHQEFLINLNNKINQVNKLNNQYIFQKKRVNQFKRSNKNNRFSFQINNQLRNSWWNHFKNNGRNNQQPSVKLLKVAAMKKIYRTHFGINFLYVSYKVKYLLIYILCFFNFSQIVKH